MVLIPETRFLWKDLKAMVLSSDYIVESHKELMEKVEEEEEEGKKRVIFPKR